jgi:glycosyltransferase involved in cell wall biosynthesis
MSDIAAVVPLYDKAEHVEAALASIAGQSEPPQEIIVVDDGSTDGGDRRVEAMGVAGLRLIRQQNAGPGAARNAGLAAAGARHVAFLDADDVWLPDHLAGLRALAQDFPGHALYANPIAAMGDAPVAPSSPAVIHDYAAAWLGGLVVSTIGVMVDREAALAVGGFSTAAHRGEDLALWLKLTRGRPMAMGGAVGALYRRDASELTRRPASGPDAAMQWIDAYLAGGAADRLERATLAAYRARLAILHAAEWIRHGGRDEARLFLAMAEDGARDRAQLKRLNTLAGPLWPVRNLVIAARRMLR